MAGDRDDAELRALWRQAGGRFHGPNIETGCMPESQLLPFLRAILAERDALQAKVEAMEKDAGRYRHIRPHGFVGAEDEAKRFDAEIDAARAALAQPTGETE